jgi:hypothetical protein
MARTFVIAPILMVLAVLSGSAQSDLEGLRKNLESRFEILPIASGVVLTPRFRTSVKSIEVSNSAIAIDGAPVTGGELRDRLGNDADIVLQFSYLDGDTRRALARGEATPTTPKPVDPTTPTLDPRSVEPDRPAVPRPRRRGEVVRVGGSVTVEADEFVRGDVVAVGGAARINGEVDGNVVAIGGGVTLGPSAFVHGDVTSVGGGVYRDATAVVRGGVQDIGIGGLWVGDWGRRGDWDWNWGGFYPVARLTGTLVRITLLAILVAVVLFVARQPVEQIAERVAADPVKSWFVGFLAEMLFLPVLIMTVVVLAISIIGIPLLVLVPIAIVAGLLVMLVGFTAVAYQIGRLLQDKIDVLRTRPYAATLAGILLIVSPVLLARLLNLSGDFWFMVWPVAAVGFLFEYIAWTTGLGAAALARWDRPTPPPTTAMTTTGTTL